MNIENIAKNFQRRGFSFSYFENSSDALSYISQLISKKCSIGFGGSQTIKECGLLSALINDDYTVYHRDIFPDMDKEELYQKMHLADWYISSANALSETGEIINIDGRGNRVGEIINGPKNVLIVCGINKMVTDITSGIDRTRNIASPPNCRRLSRKTPCSITGKCCYCNSNDTICNTTVILHHPTTGRKVYIVLINKNFGY